MRGASPVALVASPPFPEENVRIDAHRGFLVAAIVLAVAVPLAAHGQGGGAAHYAVEGPAAATHPAGHGAQATRPTHGAPAAPVHHGQAVLPTPPIVDHLPNGLTVVTVPWNSPGIIAYYTLMRVGSRDEVEAHHTGFAHLFEHMMFRGTHRYPATVYDQTIQSFGADGNAYTTQDFTLFTITAPKSALAKIADLESDRFQHLYYDQGQFRTETGAVLGEYNKDAADPGMKMWEALSEISFAHHTYGHTTMGYLADVEAMPHYFAYSRSFFHRFYTPDDATVIVAGDVDHDQLLSLVRANYGHWHGHRAHPHIPKEPPPSGPKSRDVAWQGTSPPRILLAWRTPAFDGGAHDAAHRAAALRETAALDVIHGLAFSEPSPLYQQLVVDQQKVLALDSEAGDYNRDPGLFSVSATLKPGTDPASIVSAIQAEVGRIAAGQVAAERIAAVQSHLRYGMIMGLETPADVADLLGRFIAVGGTVGTLDEYMNALAQVTPADVARVAGAYLTEKRRAVVTLTPTPVEHADMGGVTHGSAARGGAR